MSSVRCYAVRSSVVSSRYRKIAVTTAGWLWEKQRPAALPHISVARPQGPGTTETPGATNQRPPHKRALVPGMVPSPTAQVYLVHMHNITPSQLGQALTNGGSS